MRASTARKTKRTMDGWGGGCVGSFDRALLFCVVIVAERLRVRTFCAQKRRPTIPGAFRTRAYKYFTGNRQRASAGLTCCDVVVVVVLARVDPTMRCYDDSTTTTSSRPHTGELKTMMRRAGIYMLVVDEAPARDD